MDPLSEYFKPELVHKAQEANPFLKLNDVVYNIIENGIIYGMLPPGTRLGVVRIAGLLEVSRTTVSEALEQLSNEGLVVTPSNRKGHYVFDISHTSLEQLFMARKSLEGTAAYICARQKALIDMDRMRSLAVQFRRAFDERKFDNFAEVDQEFHSHIVISSRNPYLVKMYKAMNRFISYYSIRSQEYLLSLQNEPTFAVLAGEHMAIYRAIELGIPELAETTSKNHLNTCYNLCMRYHTTVGTL